MLEWTFYVGLGRFWIWRGGGGGARGKVQNIGGGGQVAKLYAGRKLIGALARPQSVPNSYISHIENWWYSKIKNRIEKYSFTNTFK